jgi:hypothetical protein
MHHLAGTRRLLSLVDPPWGFHFHCRFVDGGQSRAPIADVKLTKMILAHMNISFHIPAFLTPHQDD